MKEKHSFGYRTAQFEKLISKVVKGAIHDVFGNDPWKGASSLDVLREEGEEIGDGGEREETQISSMAAQETLAILHFHLERRGGSAQRCLFRAARAVVEEGVDPRDSRSFYEAMYWWIRENEPQCGINRDNIRVYWFLLCKTLREAASKEGVL